jgi:hypothetical protein
MSGISVGSSFKPNTRGFPFKKILISGVLYSFQKDMHWQIA